MKKHIITVILFFTTLVHSENVKKMDILGIYLGDSWNSIKESLPCKDLKPQKMNKHIIYKYYLTCETNQERLSIEFDHDKNVIGISRTLTFTHAPNLLKLKETLISKYGSPTLDGRFTTKKSSGFKYGMCYSESCEYQKQHSNTKGKFPRFSKKNSQTFVVWIHSLDNFRTEKKPDYSLNFNMYDNAAAEKNYEWGKNAEKEAESKIIDKESDIKL